MKPIHFLYLTLLLVAGLSKATNEPLDRIAVIVDQGVVLESEITALTNRVKAGAIAKGQQLPSDRALRTQATEKLIVTQLQLQRAERMGIQISDIQLDQTIANMAKSDGTSFEQLRANIEASGEDFQQYREDVKTELLTTEVTRANVRRRVFVSPQEIDMVLKLMEQQGNTQTEFRVGHILVGFPPKPTEDDIQEAKTNADKVLKLLNDGSNFEKVAIGSSSGSEALDGGDMGWLNINAMPTLFAEAIQSRKKGDLIGPIRSGAGFHILKLADIRGQEVVEVQELNARHILLQASIIQSEQRTKEILQQYRADILSGEAEFSELAKAHSEDPGTALQGGELGWADPEKYDPAFKDTLKILAVDEISEPFRSSFGWHIAQLLGKRTQDISSKVQRNKAYQLLFNRKFGEEADVWLRELRESAYVEVVSE